MKKITAIVLMVMLAVAGSGHAQARDGLGLRVSFHSAVQAAMPAVVSIYTSKLAAKKVAEGKPGYPDEIRDKLLRGQGAPVRDKIERSLGSGVLIDGSGVVVTNRHVIEDTVDMTVALGDGREFKVESVRSDERLDLAVLKLKVPQGTRLPVVKFGNSDSLQVGDVVLALGNPYGIGQSVTMGVVSAVNRSAAKLSPYGQFIQTDAAINPGNSGGALVDSSGALIGVNTAIYTRNGGNQGISFAIPANLVARAARDLVTTGSVRRPWLGAEGETVSEALANRIGLSPARGVLVQSVMPDSPAAMAGLRVTDIILAFDGQPVADPAQLGDRLVSVADKIGTRVPMTIWREGDQRTLDIGLTSLPPRNPALQKKMKGYTPLSGSTVEQLSTTLNAEMGWPLATQGVVVVATGDTGDVDLQPGDLLISIDKQPVKNVNEVQGLLDAVHRTWELRYQRGPKVLKATISR
ncbi:MAG TPA: trypsin-like peptidase domain-containing protein [Alphaproteobacteria bacterium]|nr:trypsin-like peptidase domain-containing protein [Alphaproteobacteria bacterium]